VAHRSTRWRRVSWARPSPGGAPSVTTDSPTRIGSPRFWHRRGWLSQHQQWLGGHDRRRLRQHQQRWRGDGGRWLGQHERWRLGNHCGGSENIIGAIGVDQPLAAALAIPSNWRRFQATSVAGTSTPSNPPRMQRALGAALAIPSDQCSQRDIAGGEVNKIHHDAAWALIGAPGNSIGAYAEDATIGGGRHNTNSGVGATIGGGRTQPQQRRRRHCGRRQREHEQRREGHRHRRRGQSQQRRLGDSWRWG